MPSGSPMASKTWPIGAYPLISPCTTQGRLLVARFTAYTADQVTPSRASCLDSWSETHGLHVGGRTALDWYGIRQYVSQRPVTELYGLECVEASRVVHETFPADYHRKRLFKEEPNAPCTRHRSKAVRCARVSEPERRCSKC